jgi:hypothetical protein
MPKNAVKKLEAVPIDKISDVVTIAMVHPLDKTVIEQLQKMIKGSLKIFTTTTQELNEMVERYYL